MDMRALLDGLCISDFRARELFPKNYAITQSDCEISQDLTWCETCLEKGLHLAVHQMIWMRRCPIHNEPLRCVCECGKTIPFTLVQRSTDSASLCKCGKLRFGRKSHPSSHELMRLQRELSKISHLQLILRNGLDAAWLCYGSPRGDQFVDLERLVANLLGAWLCDWPPGVDKPGYSCMHIPEENWPVDEIIKVQFEEFFEFANSGRADPWFYKVAAVVGDQFQDSIFSKGIDARLRAYLTVNGAERCDWGSRYIDIAKVVLANRLIDGFHRRVLPTWSKYSANFDKAASLYGMPLFVASWADEEKSEGTAYWLRPTGYRGRSDVHWIEPLAEVMTLYLFCEPYQTHLFGTQFERRESSLWHRSNLVGHGTAAETLQLSLFN